MLQLDSARPLLFLIILSLAGCNYQEMQISSFEDRLGADKTPALNLLVENFEDNPKTIYPKISTNSAYVAFLTAVKEKRFNDFENLLYMPAKVREAYINSGLHNDFHNHSKNYLEYNLSGDFFRRNW